MDVLGYIRQYCENRGIIRYDVKAKVLTKEDFARSHTFAPGVAFFYRFVATGTIDNIADINNRVLDVTSGNEFYDYSKIVNIKDFDTVQQATADFIFNADNMLQLDLKEGANALFSTIYTAQFFYYYVTVLERKTKNADAPRRNVYVEVENM